MGKIGKEDRFSLVIAIDTVVMDQMGRQSTPPLRGKICFQKEEVRVCGFLARDW